MGNTCRGQQQQAAPGTSSPKRGCTIHKAEYRGITLGQLKDIVKEIKKRCKKEGWTSANPDDNGKLLKPEEVTLYDLVKHYIIPVTASRKCSYVELVSTGEQKPAWFVSHWWGEPVFDFVKCIEQHADDRLLFGDNAYDRYTDITNNEDITYWVCAYALNQHNATDEIGDGDPTHSPFYRAMQLTDGMVSVLDKDAVCYSRIWCAFEVYIAFKDITEQREAVLVGKKYLYDVYTCAPHTCRTAVGLTDGRVDIDVFPQSKQEREKHFPLDLCQAALTIQLESAKASIEEDRWRILNWIVQKGHGNPNAEPPLTHPAYNEVNAFLRRKFLAAAYPHAVEVGQDVELYHSALQSLPLDTLEISFSKCDAFCNEALRFTNALPANLSKLHLDLSSNKFDSSSEFAIGFSRLSNLVSFKLNLWGCQELTSLKVLWDELKDLDSLKELHLWANYCCKLEHLSAADEKLVPLPKHLTSLDLDFYSCNLLSLDGLSIGLRQLHRLSTLRLDFILNSALTSIDKLGQAIAHLTSLESLELHFYGCEKLSSLVELETGLRPLQRLSTLQLDFGCDSAITSMDQLGQAIAHLTSLKSLDLSFSLQHPPHMLFLLSIYLPWFYDKYYKSSVNGLATAISGLELLSDLKLSFGFYSFKKVQSFSPFAHAIKPLHRLMKVELKLYGDCTWDEHDSRVLCHNLSELPNLQHLELYLPGEIKFNSRVFGTEGDRDRIDKFLRDRLANYEG